MSRSRLIRCGALPAAACALRARAPSALPPQKDAPFLRLCTQSCRCKYAVQVIDAAVEKNRVVKLSSGASMPLV